MVPQILIQPTYHIIQIIFKSHIRMAKPYIPLTTTLAELDCEKAFNALADKQAHYAYNFVKSAWNGSKICYFERSYESPALLYIILKAFEQGARPTVDAIRAKFDEVALNQILIYIAAFIDNNGNYKSFGDSKFIPECTEEVFRNFFLATPYWSAHPQEFSHIYDRISKMIFNADTPYGLIDFSDRNGTNGYYSKNVTFHDAEKIKEIMIKKGIRSENNRLTKQDNTHYTIKIASIDVKQQEIVEDGIHIKLQYGEFAPFLKQTNSYLAKAKKYAANEIQQNMINQYIQHFQNGDMNNHIESQKHWIQDKGPIIETNIGFIETYLDPLKLRAEFEGFVAVVNQEESLLLNKLVEGAQKTLKYLPWGPNFEVDVFQKPDFTSLDVLGFASSGIPVGINIPNYDHVREHFGFKNVNLGNAYGKPTVESLQYTPVNEYDLHLKYYNPSLFVVVALHELLGHGSGKLLHEKPDFVSPLDGKEITTFYQPNQTWSSVFGKIASFYEECKADCVALYLSTFEDVQETLLPSYTPEERWDIVFVGWFDMILGGLKGLEYYDVEHKKWLQAHIGASYAILSVLREEGGIFEIKETERNGEPYLEIHLNKDSIRTKGKDAIGRFLSHLQIYKSTADAERGTAFFQKYLEVDETFLKYKEIVRKNKRPRKLTVQPDLKIVDGKVHYVKFENTTYGQIEAALSHYGENVEDILGEWEKNNQEFVY